MDIFLGCDRWIDRELPEAKINLSARGFLDSSRGVGASDRVVVAVPSYNSLRQVQASFAHIILCLMRFSSFQAMAEASLVQYL